MASNYLLTKNSLPIFLLQHANVLFRQICGFELSHQFVQVFLPHDLKHSSRQQTTVVDDTLSDKIIDWF